MTDRRHRALTSEEALAKCKRAYEERKLSGKPFDLAMAAAAERMELASSLVRSAANARILADVLCASPRCRARVGRVVASDAGPLFTYRAPYSFKNPAQRKADRAAGVEIPLHDGADLLDRLEPGEEPWYVLWCQTHEYLEVDGDELLTAIRAASGRLTWRASFAQIV